MASSVAFPAALVTGTGKADARLVGSGYGGSGRVLKFRKRARRAVVRSSLDEKVSDMSVNAACGYVYGGRAPGPRVDIYESRPFIGGKVGSFVDRCGNHIEMGAARLPWMLQQSISLDEKELDFRFPIGAPLHGIRAFFTTNQLQTYHKARNAIALAVSPVVKALIDPDGSLRDIHDLDRG